MNQNKDQLFIQFKRVQDLFKCMLTKKLRKAFFINLNLHLSEINFSSYAPHKATHKVSAGVGGRVSTRGQPQYTPVH